MLEQRRNDNKGNQAVVSNGIQWFIHKIDAENSSAALAEALIPIDYEGVDEKFELVTLAGFTFNENELSEYSEDMKSMLLELISTFKKS